MFAVIGGTHATHLPVLEHERAEQVSGSIKGGTWARR
jgi:hypothetical protein